MLHAEKNNDRESYVSQFSDYSQYYKNAGRTLESTIQQKREDFLLAHKEKHNAFLDGHRDISKLFKEVESIENEDCHKDDSMEVDTTQYKSKKRVRFKMTMSEWFTEIPEDVSEKWLVKFCPQGKRRLIISNGRTTKVFDKFGHYSLQFQSNLPGGRKLENFCTEKSGLTVLDCIFNEKSKIFFVLDVLVWNSTSLLECEAELRHCWIRAKNQEDPDFFIAYGKDSYNFVVLLDYPADRQVIRNEIWQFKHNCDIICDGLIFYHKEASYKSGHTKLVTWLKPFMLPEKLNVEIPDEYLERKPNNYTDLKTYLKRIKGKKKNEREYEDESAMEAEDY